MKKHLLLLLCLCLPVLSSIASNDSIFIDLDNNNSSQTVKRYFYDLTIAKVSINDKGIATISISINNTSPHFLYLFNRGYSKREVRREHDLIVKDYNCENMLETNYCEFLNRTYQITPNSSSDLGQIQINEDEENTVFIPIYVAKLKSSICNKLEVLNWELLKIVIHVNSEPDNYYSETERQCDSLIDIISQQKFCRHPQHNPKLEKQEEPFKTEINALRLACNKKLIELPKDSKYYKKYEDLKERLDNIDFANYEIDDCGDAKAHRSGSTHAHCKYCDMKFEQISEELDQLWWKLDNGTMNKEDAVKIVNKILNCCRNSPKHASDWKNSKTKFKNSSEESCKRIKNY